MCVGTHKLAQGLGSCRAISHTRFRRNCVQRAAWFVFGFQIGGSETDIVMLLMNQAAIDKLLSGKFTIGGDASVAAGPVGRTSSAATDAQLHAELLTYSRTRGLFAGVSQERNLI